MIEKGSYEEEEHYEEPESLSDDELFLTLKIEVDNLKRQLHKRNQLRDEYKNMEKNYRNVIPKNDVNNLLFAGDVIFDTSVKIIRLFRKITKDDLVDIHLNKKELETKEEVVKDEDKQLQDKIIQLKNKIREQEWYKPLHYTKKMHYMVYAVKQLKLYLIENGPIEINEFPLPDINIVLSRERGG